MQSDLGIASLAVSALADGDEDGYSSYISELTGRRRTRTQRKNLLREAGQLDALASCITHYSFGRAGEINRLIAWMLTLTNPDDAERILLKSFVKRAKQEQGRDRVQRLYKIAIRYVDPIRATRLFCRLDLPITVPAHVVMMLTVKKRQQPLGTRLRAVQLVMV